MKTDFVGRKSVSEKKDWNTPPKYVDAIKRFFNNDIKLDPCSNNQSMIEADVKYILPTDGLKESWSFDTIFINPPYGRNPENKTTIKDWLIKGQEAFHNGSELLYLIPVATNTSHFKEIIFKEASSICFLEDTRLKFWNNGMEMKKGAPMACCFVYFGDRVEFFFKIFEQYGKCFEIIP